MTDNEKKEAVASYSRGEINRAELGFRVGHEVDFAKALQLLRQYQLPLPHQLSDPQSPGVQLISSVSIQADRTCPVMS